MPKHRGPILEHQTSRPASLSDFFMENATTSQKLACASAVQYAATAAGNGRSSVGAWKQALRESRNGMWGRGEFLNLLSTTIIYYHSAGRGHSPRRASFGDARLEHGDAERASGAKDPPVRSRPEQREWTNEPNAHQVARNS